MPAAVVVASSFYDVARSVRRRREISSLEKADTRSAQRAAFIERSGELSMKCSPMVQEKRCLTQVM